MSRNHDIISYLGDDDVVLAVKSMAERVECSVGRRTNAVNKWVGSYTFASVEVIKSLPSKSMLRHPISNLQARVV